MESAAVLAPSSPRGFTLIEMLVVLSIIAIITSIALFGQSTFNRSVLLTDTAYTVALSLREMQSLGLSSRKFGSIQNAGYGGRFVPATPGSYLLFADVGGTSALANCPTGTSGQPDAKPGNCRYDSGTDGTVRTYTFNRRFEIASVCGTPASGAARDCSTTGSITALEVTFVRSNTTDTVMTGYMPSATALSKAEVYLRSVDGGDTRAVCISQAGQISIAYTTCP
jgi:prepilin-type N-terminal cleavage/methylation domain-containing protein